MSTPEPTPEAEIDAMQKMILAIKDFPAEARSRVLRYVAMWAEDAKTLPKTEDAE